MTPTTGEIWDRFSNALSGFIRRRVPDRDDAEDILQEVFLKIHSGIGSLRSQESIAPWLYRITRRTIIDYYRRRPGSDLSVPDLPEIAAEGGESFIEEPAGIIAAELHEFIASLPEKYREAVSLSELRGMKQADVAASLGLSVSGAKSRIQRGRVLLKQALLKCCHFEFDRRGNLYNYVPRRQCCRRCASGSEGSR